MLLSIVIPCYNEEKNIENLINSFEKFILSKVDAELVLVDNGSRDNTSAQIKSRMKERKYITIVTVPENKGYGNGVLHGLNAAKGDWIGSLHADLQVPINVMEPIIDLIIKNPSPNNYYKGLRRHRSLLDKFFTFNMGIFESCLFRTRMHDIGAVPVVFHKSFLKNLIDPPYDFTFELYTYYLAKVNNMNIIRVKAIMSERVYGISSWNKGLKSRILLSKDIIDSSFIMYEKLKTKTERKI